ncbi:hypothetical protein ACQR3Q_05370 [Dietzia natronolimnaea]|uniref:hypothetical protein n=1 Tax=Dietzia natronolimnaea TaxID=161920 RepID=UPI003D096AC6
MTRSIIARVPVVAATSLMAAAVVAVGAPVATAQTGSPSSAELGSELGDAAGSVQELEAIIEGMNPGARGALDNGSLANLNELIANIRSGEILDVFRVVQGIPGGSQDIMTLAERASLGEVGWDRVLAATQVVLAPVTPCNTFTNSGRQGIFTNRHEIGRSGGGRVLLRLETYYVPDFVEVAYDGTVLWTTPGYVGTNGDWHVWIDVPPGVSTSMTVKVDAPRNGTEWNYTLGCPL